MSERTSPISPRSRQTFADADRRSEELFAFAENPLIALMIGVLATGLIQSSSTTTSIVVGLAAGGLPMEICIPMLMGANIGTTVTGLIAAFSASGVEAEAAMTGALVPVTGRV